MLISNDVTLVCILSQEGITTIRYISIVMIAEQLSHHYGHHAYCRYYNRLSIPIDATSTGAIQGPFAQRAHIYAISGCISCWVSCYYMFEILTIYDFRLNNILRIRRMEDNINYVDKYVEVSLCRARNTGIPCILFIIQCYLNAY